MAEDVRALRALVAARYAYVGLVDAAWEARLDSIAGALPDDVTRAALAAAVERLLAGFDDGHTRVSRADLDPHARHAHRARLAARAFMRDSEPPRVVNVAAVRLAAGEDSVPALALADRELYPAGWHGFGDAERRAIAAAAARLRPEWVPAGRLGDWRWFVLRPDPAGPRLGGVPVAVLIDEGCYSACEQLAAAFRGAPRACLFGEATGGGSGRPHGFTLPRSGIRLQLATMVSYRPDGTLIQGRGVAPDVAVAGDAALARARRWIAGGAGDCS